jgi:hypothetical protein
VHTMKCKIYSSIEQKDKLLAPKWDFFWNMLVAKVFCSQ